MRAPQAALAAAPEAVPESAQMERAVLAGVLLDPSVLPEVEAIVDPGDFHERRHARLLEAMRSLADEGKSIDVRMLEERLREWGAWDQVGGIAYLAGLDLDLPDLSRTREYARQLRKLSLARQAARVLELAQRQVIAARDPEALRDQVCELQRLLDTGVVELSGSTFAERVAPAAARYRAIKAGDHARAGIPTGFPGLDDELVGFCRRDLVVLAGYAGEGKTSFTEQLAQHWLELGLRVTWVNLEMGEEQMEDRLFARAMRHHQRDLRRGRWQDEDLARVEAELAGAEWPRRLRWLFPRSSEVTDVVREVHAAHRTDPCDVLVVDHLAELTSRAARGDSRVETTHAVTACKGLARELDIPVVAPHQLSRAGAQRGGRGDDDRAAAPRLWHLGESVYVERKADVVLMFWSPTEGGTTRRIHIAKARQGEKGYEVEFEWDARTRTYREAAPSYRHQQAEPTSAPPPWS